MGIPQIRIQSSLLLFHSVSEEERQKWATSSKMSALNTEDIGDYSDQLRKVWRVYERQILESMVNLYGVEFKKTIIDVYVNPWNQSISNPLIINPSREPAIQIETLMHELLHVLFTDNSAFSMHDTDQNVKLIDEWRKIFGSDLEWKTLVHIPVHAGLKALFLDVLDAPERLTRDIVRHQGSPAYKQAWQYVEDHDYRQINDELRSIYRRLALSRA